MTLTAYELTAYARAGKTRQMADSVRMDLAHGRAVLIAGWTGGASAQTWLDEYDRVTPIGPGDWVRWDNPLYDQPIWVTGEVTAIGGGVVRIMVAEVSPWRPADRRPCVGRAVNLGYGCAGCMATMRRIPRPEPAYHHTMELDPPSKHTTAVDDQIRRNIAQSGQLVDGLSLDECRRRWLRNRHRIEPNTYPDGIRQPGRVAPPLEPLTDAQIAAVKSAQAEREATWWPQELRELIAKRAAAESNPIRADLWCDPWE